ncbi:ribonuclease Z [Zeaxanthinibacter enoshimensis]|uniref:Ribonuclease Z n=1 Tax=Zeaxanthinibacter enoshimensis TaxID=392009 RepID=A0A4R6TMW0_9FLAO|nr:ribonuclease Z [Zeaxanthinibacter enoshimensis]TDQ31005.1 ribonuclease Z [Zeaxanthinibacter enoshimensis]
MKVHILGCYAATPRTLTNPTAQVLEIKNHLFLIDCGEGTQVELRRQKIRFSRINHIFISHLHGDHFFGLPGLVASFRLLGRQKALHIYGPKGLKEAITLLLKLGNSWTNYPLLFHELVEDQPVTLYEDEVVSVDTIPLDHRIYTNGFLFREKPSPRKLNVEATRKYRIPKEYFQLIKQGNNYELEDGTLISNRELTLDPPAPMSYAYCSDTAFNPRIVPQISGVQVLYHESTFLRTEHQLALKTGHSTAAEAAEIARQAGVAHLILGHYSTRYRDIEKFRQEAQTVFPEVLLAEDGKSFEF